MAPRVVNRPRWHAVYRNEMIFCHKIKVVKNIFQLNKNLLKHLIPSNGYSPYYYYYNL